jgi:two-component system alkaline phosphatase synthesis response regulator PhoP
MFSDKKVLLVDDDLEVIEILQYHFKNLGCEIYTAHNGKDAVQLAAKIEPHLIIMDIMMPLMDGIEACRQIREMKSSKDTIIVFLTARVEEYSEVASFEAGGNDYIIKPIKIRAFMGRMKAYFERATPSDLIPKEINLKDLIINKDTFSIQKGVDRIVLPKKEFELLFLLSLYPNKVFSRDFLLKQVWGFDIPTDTRTVDVHVRRIREKLGEGIISTVKGVGYKLEY